MTLTTKQAHTRVHCISSQFGCAYAKSPPLLQDVTSSGQYSKARGTSLQTFGGNVPGTEKKKTDRFHRSCAGTRLREVILFIYFYLPAESVSALKLIVPVVVVVIVVGGVVVAVLSC